MRTFTDSWVRNEYNCESDVKVGDVVKLKNHGENGGEAFWVVVTTVMQNGDLIGRVDNKLVLEQTQYNYKDLVSFNTKDVRDHKNKNFQYQQLEVVKKFICDLAIELGRVPSREELEHLLVRFSVN